MLVSLLGVQCGGGGSTAVAAVAVAPAGVTLGVGQTATLTARAINAEGGAVAGKTYTLSTSSATVASVSGAGNSATVTRSSSAAPWSARPSPARRPATRRSSTSMSTTGTGPGQETITITKLNPGGVYRYSVHDFTNRENAGRTELGRSGAKVELYTAAGLRTFFVPKQSGNLWTVFELSGDIANPTITARNEMGAAEIPDSIP